MDQQGPDRLLKTEIQTAPFLAVARVSFPLPAHALKLSLPEVWKQWLVPRLLVVMDRNEAIGLLAGGDKSYRFKEV